MAMDRFAMGYGSSSRTSRRTPRRHHTCQTVWSPLPSIPADGDGCGGVFGSSAHRLVVGDARAASWWPRLPWWRRGSRRPRRACRSSTGQSSGLLNRSTPFAGVPTRFYSPFFKGSAYASVPDRPPSFTPAGQNWGQNDPTDLKTARTTRPPPLPFISARSPRDAERKTPHVPLCRAKRGAHSTLRLDERLVETLLQVGSRATAERFTPGSPSMRVGCLANPARPTAPTSHAAPRSARSRCCIAWH